MRKYHQVSDALRSLVPNAKLYVCDEDYDKLEWDESNTDTKPTKEQVEAEIERLDAEFSGNCPLFSLSSISQLIAPSGALGSVSCVFPGYAITVFSHPTQSKAKSKAKNILLFIVIIILSLVFESIY